MECDPIRLTPAPVDVSATPFDPVPPLLAQHEELPDVGESFDIGAHRFEVREISDRRIELVRVTRA